MPIELAKGEDGEHQEIKLECTLDEALGFESVRESACLRLAESPANDPTETSASRTSSRCRITPVSSGRIRALSTPT